MSDHESSKIYQILLNDFDLEDQNVVGAFTYGSRVYGTNRENSDHDFIIVCKSLTVDTDRLDSQYRDFSISLYSESQFLNQVDKHVLSALECLFLPFNFILKNNLNIKFKLNKSNLRRYVSEKCSKDWNQAKKRFIDSNDQGFNQALNERYVRKVYEGKKSLFHCFRMLDFATQIINYNTIQNFGSCNQLWEEIYTDPSEEWPDYHDKYHTDYNNKLIEFRKIAPK